MKYMGSKARHAKDIVPLLQKARKDNQLYVEPFVGGANIIDKLSGSRLGNDLDLDLICLWQAVAEGWEPPEKGITEKEYQALKTAPASPLKGYAAFALSYAGKKWGGWRRDSLGTRDYVNEAWRNAKKQFPKLLGVQFVCSPYQELTVPSGSLVYCDPPYAGTTSYKSNFDSLSFWRWVEELSRRCQVFVSEYNAPEGFSCVWEKEVTSSLTADTGSKIAVERLWTRV